MEYEVSFSEGYEIAVLLHSFFVKLYFYCSGFSRYGCLLYHRAKSQVSLEQ